MLAVPVLESIEQWEEKNIYDSLTSLVKELEIKNGQMFWPVRIAISGQLVTPGVAIEIAEVLGKDESIRRIKYSY